ncbi:2' O-ribose methyltransferase [Sporothrix bragantina]|uniref:rRNA methyltransferase 2, mitochondrial n=1 Tax=Sporothrix bragantina TaxID=671064 RepID=A0ABP0AMS3_9PEZI
MLNQQSTTNMCTMLPTILTTAASNTRWKARQGKDQFAREAKVRGLKSRAAFKLLEMDAKYRLFKPGQTVVDLGYAPGSWSQVAAERTKPAGRVLGIDLIPAQPPRGVSTIQGNFLAPTVRQMVKDFLARRPALPKVSKTLQTPASSSTASTSTDDADPESQVQDYDDALETEAEDATSPEEGTVTDVVVDRPSYIEMERQASAHAPSADAASATEAQNTNANAVPGPSEAAPAGGHGGRMVDVVLSDMSEPWPQTHGFWLNTLSNPYHRMMNTSGNAFRDHAGSMDLCHAALEFASDTLRAGGHFVCKFYQGGEDKVLEKRLKKMFSKVVREKPESSRSESKENFFVALRRKKDVTWDDIKDL